VNLLKALFERLDAQFEGEGKLKRFYPAYDAFKTLTFVLPTRTTAGAHIRDAFDSKRMMVTVILALLPATLVGVYNIGYQRLMTLGMEMSFWPIVGAGLVRFLPILVVTYIVGLGWEFIFAIVRRHEVSEGFLVSGFLIALIVPPTLPIWQLVIAVSFGVVIGKEIFGGTGMNIFNPALVVRSFLFFAYPGQISGDVVWIAADGITAATPLAVASEGAGVPIASALAEQGFGFWNSFLGLIPGSIGETSTLAILLGAVLLLVTGVGSWRIMLSMLVGGVGMVLLLNAGAPNPGHFLALPVHYHLVLGGFAFALVFMATDPVSGSATNTGKFIYGFLCGVLAILIRAINPVFPEGAMLAILFMNMFAPLIDYYVVRSNMKRRALRGQARLATESEAARTAERQA
jgi:Na+-transporting NADH:ubiquinone oxidoreductase subunit B